MNEEKELSPEEIKIVGSSETPGAPVPDTPPSQATRLYKKYTMDGEVLVEEAVGKSVEEPATETKEYPLKTVELLPFLPPSFSETHVIEMKLFHSLLLTIKKRHPRRQIPVTRSEFLSAGGNNKYLRQLINFGFLQEAIIPIVSAVTGKNKGSRVCVYYTPQGRALIRQKLDPQYAKTDYQ